MASIYEELIKKRQADLDAKGQSLPEDSRAEFLNHYIQNRQKQEASMARGQQLVEAQRARDTINQATSNTAATYDFAHGQLPSISNAQAFQNAQRQTSLDDSLNQIMGNNVLTDAGRVSKAQEAYSSILSAPTVSATPTAQEVANAYRQSYANFNTPMQKAVQAVDAYKTEREQQNLERNRDVGSQRRIHEIRNRLSQEKDRQENARKDREEIVNRLAEINRELEADPLHTGLFPELEAEKAELEKRLAENDTLFANGGFDNRINALNSQLDEALKAQYASIPYAPDFAERSQSVRDSTKTERINPLTREEYDRMTPEEQMRYRMDHPWESQVTLSDVLSKNGDPFFDPVDAYSHLEYMTDAQRGTYNYLYNTSGADAANEYLERMRPQFEAQMAQNITERTAEHAERHPLISSAESVLSNIGKAPAAVANIANSLAGNETNPNAWYNRAVTLTDTTRSTVGQKFAENAAKKFSEWGASDEASQFAGNTANFLYGTGLSMIDSMVNAAIGSYVTGASALNPAVNSPEEIKKVAEKAANFTRTLMALEATPSALIEAKERGLSDTQAMTIGLIAGAAEYITEKWSLENLFSADWEENTLKNLVKQVFSESSEEGASNLINLFTDILVAGDKSDWRKTVNEYKSTGDNDKQAFWHTMRDKAIDLGVDMLGGAISGGGMGAGRVVGGAVNNAQYRVHNQMRTEGQKQGGVDYLGDMTRLAENAMNLATDSAEQIEALHTLNDEMERFYPNNTTKRTIDFLVEGAKIAQANGDGETALNYKLLERTVRNNQQTFTDRLNQNRQAAQQTAQTETAPEQTAPLTETAEPSTEPSTAEAAPSTDSTTPSIQAITQAETAQTASDARQAVQNETSAVGTGENAVAENSAQNASTNATENAERNEPGYRPSERRVGAAAFGFSEDLDPEQAASTILRRVMQNAKDPMALAKSGVRKAAIDGLNASVNNAIQSGQYTTEEAEALKNYTNRVRDALRNSNDTLQKTLNATSAVLKRYGVKNIKIDETLTDARGYHKGDTIYVNPYLDTMQSVASVIAHETFHQARMGDKSGKLLDDIDKYYTALAGRSQNREDTDGQFSVSNTGGRVNLYTDAQFVRTYADKIWEEFSPTEAGEAALNAYYEQHRDTTMEEAIAAVYEADPEKFWSDYWKPSESGETARDYIREEKAANFIEQLAGTDGGALFRELVRDDRNLAQRIIDTIRNFLKLPAKERRFEGAEAYQRLADKFEKALADATGEEQQRAEMTAATAEDIPDSGKFSLSRPVERVGDLIAVHNLTEDKYLSSHKLGGFPAPSIAVVKAKTGHSDYGDISVVFSSDTIDPQKDSRNRIFGGDAWTPMFPNVAYDYDKTGVQNLDAALYKLANSLNVPGLSSDNTVAKLVKDSKKWGDTSIDSVVRILSANRTVQAAYLAARGGTLEAKDHFGAFDELDKKAPVNMVAKWIRPAVEFISDNGSVTVSGKRVPLTAENVVRAMYDGQGSRGVEIYEADANGLRSMAAPEFRSIEEVRENRDKLKRLDDKEYQDIVRRLDGYIGSIMDELREFNEDRPGLDYDTAILDALREGGSEEDIRYTFEEAGISINDKLVRDIGMLYKLASQLPTDYFEAKPERVVGFDEVMYYVVPDQVSEDVLHMMEKDGAGIRTYVTGNNKDRVKVLNSLKDVRFSREINTEQTETEAFKKWFEDSKAVDENGEPLVLYHGTDYYKPINIFKSGKHGYLGPGIYLTPNESFAQRYADKSGPGGTVYATWVKIENPLYVTSAEPAQEILKAITGSDRVYNNRMAKQAWSSQILTKSDMNKLRAKGYDGIIWQYGKSPAEYMVFESNQIKSATDNVGSFDANNPDIRYSRELDDTYMNAVSSNNEAEAQRIVDESAEAAMPNSKVRTRNGKLMKVYHGTTAQFNIFDPSKMGGKNGINEGFGIYLTDNPDISAQYGERQIAAYANIQRPAYGYKKTIKRGELTELIKASCEKEAQQFVDDGEYDSIKDAIKDTWISNYVDTYNVPSINAAYTQVANDILSMNDSDADIIGELLIGQGIRTYDRAIEFYNEMLTPITGIDGIWQKWDKNNIILAFDSSQVKSADAVSRNDNGDVIPVSERFNSETGDIRYSREVTPEQDAEYMDAVESGDEETQNRIIEEAAKAAGAYTDEDGNPVKMYHGTDSDFTVFDPKRIGSAHNPDQYDEIFAAVSLIGYFATDNLRYAQEYSETGKTMPLYMIAQNPYEMAYRDFAEFESDDYNETVNRILEFKQKLIEQGHDGIVAYTDDGYTEYIAFKNTQMKSADPITYDDDGNVILPSQRFNPERNDIRESRDIEAASNADLRRMLRESEEKIDYLKKQWTARTAFGAAQAVKPEDFNKQVRRLKGLMQYSIVTTDEIRNGLRELYNIMERPLKGRNDTAESRWNEAAAKAEELANEWASAAAMERVINPDIADNLETYKDIYSKLRGYSGFYIVPEMTAEAGDKESLRRLRKQLSFMHLLGVDSNKAGVESGRMSIDAIYSDLSRSYPAFFGEESELSGGELNGDYAKLQAIADVAGLAWEAAHDPYSIEQTVDEQSVKTQLKDDLLHSFFDSAVPTKASSRPTENDAREAYAQGQAELGAVAESERAEGYREGYNKAKFEDEGAVEAAHMREDLMEQRFAEDAEQFQNTMRKMLNEREEKINRLEKRLIKRGWADRARIERNGVMRNLNKLNRLLENPTRKQHIPQGLRASTAKLLETVGNTRLPNGKTVFTGRMQQIQAEELEKMRNFAHEIQIGLTGAASAENSNRIASTEGFMLQLADKINALEDYYNRAIGPDVDMSLRTDDVAVTQNYGFLHSLNQILTMAVHALDDANQFTIQGKNYTAENLGSLLVGDLNGRESEGYGRQNRKLGANLSDRLRNMTYETMSADLFFGMMGDNWKNIVAHSYREGQNRQAQHEHQYIEYMKELLGDYDNMKAKRELIQITANGKPLNVTRSQLMQLYATYQRPAGRTHLENGGACFVDDRGNESRAYTVKITPEKFAELTSHLTDEDKRIADGLVKFMADECSEWGNDASMYMYGFRMYEDGSYIPLDVVNYAIPKEIADKIQKTKSIENASFTNPLKRNSVVPLRMTDIFDIANNHVRRMAAYNAYAPITNDMNRIMKLSDVSGTVQEKMGRRGYKYLQDFVQTVAANEVRNGEMAESAAPLTTAMNLYKRQAVAWNVSTMLKQPISIFRAANEIDGKYIRQALALGKDEYRRIKETMLNNSGVAYLKENGYSDVGLGKTMEKLYTKNYINDAGLLRSSLAGSKAGRGLINAYDWMTEKGMAGAGRADESTWVRIWKACELEVAENHPGMTADEKLRLVTQRFNDVIGKTQVVDTVLDTAPLMRNKAMQIFTPFMNEPTKSLGGLVAAVDGVRNNKNGAKKALGKAIGLYALSNLLIEPLVTSFVSMWRDEKDDTENFWWSLLEKMFGIKRDEDGDGKNDTTVGSVFTSNVASGLFSFPVINIFYDTISNGIQGFGSEKIDVAALSNIVSSSVALVANAGKEPDDRQKTMYRLWGDWAESIAAAAGVPAKTVRRQIAGTVRGIMDITNSDWAKWQYNKLYYNLDNASARSQKNFYDILASAYKRGDMETYEAMRKELGDIVTGTPSLVSANTIQKNIEKRGGEIVPGTDLWNLDVQSRFRLDTPVKGWKVENFLTGVYKAAEKEGVDSSVYDDVLLNMPSAYDYDGEDGEIEMTADQYDTFTRNVGSLSYKILSELSGSANADRWEKLNIDQKLHAIQKVYAYAKAKNKKDINPDYNINGQGKWMAELYDKDPNSASAAAKAVLDVAEGYKEAKKRAK